MDGIMDNTNVTFVYSWVTKFWYMRWSKIH